MTPTQIYYANLAEVARLRQGLWDQGGSGDELIWRMVVAFNVTRKDAAKVTGRAEGEVTRMCQAFHHRRLKGHPRASLRQMRARWRVWKQSHTLEQLQRAA